MKREMLALAVLAIAGGGCHWLSERGSPEVRACEHVVMATLGAPSTHRRVEARRYPRSLHHTDTYISFHAANDYGTAMRSSAVCQFGPVLTVKRIEIDSQDVSAAFAESIVNPWKARQ